jgi:hypothetical protein
MFTCKRVPFPCRRIIMNGKSLMLYVKFQFAYLIHNTSHLGAATISASEMVILMQHAAEIHCFHDKIVRTCNGRFHHCAKNPAGNFFHLPKWLKRRILHATVSHEAVRYWHGISNQERTCKRTACDFAWFVTFLFEL